MHFDEQLSLLVNAALREDIGDGDHSTLSCIPPAEIGEAVLKVKQDGVIAGVSVAQKIFHLVDPHSRFHSIKADGEMIHNGEEGFRVEAKVHVILKCERLVLNCMQRMSGIATLTRKYADQMNGFKTKLLDTRKTTPNFRLLEKEAVRIGGGVNHRFGLFDMIMLKDNHIDYAGGLESAINRAHDYVARVNTLLQIEIETRSIEDVKTVMAVGTGKVFRILLDNFTKEKVSEALSIIDGAFETEASGGINLNNIREYAATGVDYVSVGALIHQAQSLDLSLKAI